MNSILNLLVGNKAKLLIGLGVFGIMLALWMRGNAANERAEDAEAATAAVLAAHELTTARYRQAQVSAQVLAMSRAVATEAAVELEQERAREQNRTLRADYDQRLAGWLRNNANRAPIPCGISSGTDLPTTEEHLSNLAGAVPTPGTANVPVSDLRICAGSIAQLNALIDYVSAEPEGIPDAN